MIRLGLTLHYDGSGFFGWQAQAVERTVQGELEAVVARLTGSDERVIASGRTDRGVHASGQVVAVDVPERWTAASFRKSANALLPPDVWIRSARRVPEGFHPRFDAVRRTYAYRVGTEEHAPSPFLRPWCWPVIEAVDVEVLRDLAGSLPGKRSFEAFAKSGQPERGYECEVFEADWAREKPHGLTFTISANRFLHHMVRYLVGTMIDVARGRRDHDDVALLLAGGEATTSPPAPPEGLFLQHVDYTDASWTKYADTASPSPTPTR